MGKKTYTLKENLRYYMQTVRAYNPKMFIRSAIAIITTTLLVVATSLLPSLLVYLLNENLGLLTPILGLTVFMICITFVNILTTGTSKLGAIGIRIVAFSSQLVTKFLNMDFEMTEDESIHKAYRRATENGVGSNPNGGEAMYIQTQRLIQYLTIFIVFGILLSTFNPFAFVLVILSGLLNAWLLKSKRNYRESTKEARSAIDTRRYQLKRDAIKVENGKDARIYDVASLYTKKVDALTQERLVFTKKEAAIDFRNRMIFDSVIGLRDFIIYAFLIQAVINQSMSIASFTLFFTTMTQFNGWMEEITDAYHLLGLASQDINDVRTYLEFQEKTGGNPVEKQDSYTISFNNVSYRYPGASKDTLQNLNFDLNPKESIALVGINGAGKSTIVNLMLGLLHPTEGTITLNGVDIETFDRKSYFELFAPAFQENDLWALTFGQNITMRRDLGDVDMLEGILVDVGLDETFKDLPEGFDTNMTSNIHLDGTGLSGGQTQKLMLARALYKQAPILILDEPTAALDALSEQNMYEQYNAYSKEKSSLFISHRLSSTRFCDRIIFLENGKIIESGDHDSLMKENGKYAEMYAIQSQYYQKEDTTYEEIMARA